VFKSARLCCLYWTKWIQRTHCHLNFSDPFYQDLRLVFTSGLFHSEFANTDLYARPTHLILLDFDPSFGKELKLRSSSLCRFESKTSEIAVSWVATPHGLVNTYQRFRGTFCRHHVDRWSIDPDNGGIGRLAESWVLLVRSAKLLGMQGPILKLHVLFFIVLAITVELCKIVGEIIVLGCMSNGKKCQVVEVIFVIVFSRKVVESDPLCLPS